MVAGWVALGQDRPQGDHEMKSVNKWPRKPKNRVRSRRKPNHFTLTSSIDAEWQSNKKSISTQLNMKKAQRTEPEKQ